MKSVQFSEREKERRQRGEGLRGGGADVGGWAGRSMSLVHIWWRGMSMSRRETRKRHLSLQLSQKGCLEKRVYCMNDWTRFFFFTSIMTNMNITYKMPHVSTKIYSYLSSMYVQKGIWKMAGVGRKTRKWTVGFNPFGTYYRQKKKKKATTLCRTKLFLWRKKP